MQSGSLVLVALAVLFLVIGLGGATASKVGAGPNPLDQKAGFPKSYSEWIVNESPFAPWLPFSVKGNNEPIDIQDLVKSIKTSQALPNAPPLVIVPSMLGSILEAQLHGVPSKYWFCWTTWNSWFYLWFNEYEMVFERDCWFEYMGLVFNSSINRPQNFPGVQTRLVDYGGVGGVEYLDKAKQFPVWHTIISLLQSLGYEPGKSVRAAPYDWRYSPYDYMLNDFPKLKALIEDTYRINNNTKVAIASLSLGGPYFLAFLNKFVDKIWKDTYIHSFTSFDGAFGGAPSVLLGMLTKSFYSKLFDTDLFKLMIRTFGSTIWMTPWQQVFGAEQPFLGTMERNYTIPQFVQLFADARANDSAALLQLIRDKNFFSFDAPEVPTYLFYGYNVSTPYYSFLNTSSLKLGGNPEAQTTTVNGDGTIPIEGLTMLSRWQHVQKEPIVFYPLLNSVHGQSISNPDALRLFFKILLDN